MDEMEGEDEEDEGVEMEEEGAGGEEEKKVYVPGIEPLRPGEELEMDRSAYRMYHECQTGELFLTRLVKCSAKSRPVWAPSMIWRVYLSPVSVQVLPVWVSTWWRMQRGTACSGSPCPCCCARVRRLKRLWRTGTTLIPFASLKLIYIIYIFHVIISRLCYKQNNRWTAGKYKIWLGRFVLVIRCFYSLFRFSHWAIQPWLGFYTVSENKIVYSCERKWI